MSQNMLWLFVISIVGVAAILIYEAWYKPWRQRNLNKRRTKKA